MSSDDSTVFRFRPACGESMNMAQLLVRCLESEGVRFLFTLPGEETLAFMDALADSPIRLITTRHEQGAAFMADVHGRISGRAGVCVSTLGPGATNLATGIGDAFLDRAPLVAITGQASLDRRHKESHQYIDVMSMLKPLTNGTLLFQSPRSFRKRFGRRLRSPKRKNQAPLISSYRRMWPTNRAAIEPP